MATTNLLLLHSVFCGLGRGGWRRVFSRPRTVKKVVISEGKYFHIFWKAGGTYYEARGTRLERMKVLGADF